MLININSVTVSEGHIQLSSMYLDEHDGESIQEVRKSRFVNWYTCNFPHPNVLSLFLLQVKTTHI